MTLSGSTSYDHFLPVMYRICSHLINLTTVSRHRLYDKGSDAIRVFYSFNKLTLDFHAFVLLLITNVVVTLSK